ncbi:NAD-aldehyde dehydrogenase [Trametes coccinea BRFM310]|uniref:Aldehyde dehydrogenase n=1 Tax=Trametes coccinea (strain BRFM310) TaxID=1353009 RepID=A0A1Y2IFD1_TRAC3|nr:NAD-aldehyde dehydrogenase [Trametes coccinea BRFM310]
MASSLKYTPIDEIPKIHQRARDAYRSGKAKSIAFRKDQIAQVGYMLRDNEERFIEAAKRDLGRPPQETLFIDFAAVYIDVKLMYDNVEKWTKPRRVGFNLNFAPMNPRVKSEPKGVVLAIAPFNVPIFVLMSPLVGAIAGGNAVVMKPSEQSPACAALITELVEKYLDRDMFHVINGAVPETTAILELPWDHSALLILSRTTRVGRVVAQAAGKHLTPLTMEVNHVLHRSISSSSWIGKNPVVIDPRCDVRLAAKRTLWGRVCNAGQACVSPEYVLVPREFQDTFIEALREVYKEFYPEGPKNSDSFSRMVSEAHAARIKRLIDETKGTVVFGGDADIPERYVGPTVVKDVKPDDVLMSEEIFGPVLAVVPVKNVDEALEIIRSKDHPLAVYVFSQDDAFLKKVFENTESGAALANETFIHLGVPGLPAGGVGASGYGYYTGKEMFDQFTHIRVTLNNPSWVDKIGFGFRFPPYKKENLKQLRALSPALPPRPKGKSDGSASSLKRWDLWLAFVLVGATSVLLTGYGRDFVKSLTSASA